MQNDSIVSVVAEVLAAGACAEAATGVGAAAAAAAGGFAVVCIHSQVGAAQKIEELPRDAGITGEYACQQC